MVGELSSGFTIPLVPFWCMVDQNNSREGSRAQRPRDICVDHGAIMSRDRYGLCHHSLVRVCPILLHVRYSPIRDEERQGLFSFSSRLGKLSLTSLPPNVHA